MHKAIRGNEKNKNMTLTKKERKNMENKKTLQEDSPVILYFRPSMHFAGPNGACDGICDSFQQLSLTHHQ